MGKYALAGIVPAALLLGNVVALADSVKDWPSPAASTDWRGFYVGLNAGASRLSGDVSTTGTNAGAFGPVLFAEVIRYGAGSLTPDNRFTGGLQAGYNFQWGIFVYGIETDFNYLKTEATREVSIPSTVGINFTHHKDTVSTDWLYTLRPRVGIVAGPYLFYATGGLALTTITYEHVYNGSPVGTIEQTSTSETKAGWTAGGGVELSRGNWSLKAEYLYADFGSIDTNGVYQGPGIAIPQPFSHTADNLVVQVVRGGINYRFPASP